MSDPAKSAKKPAGELPTLGFATPKAWCAWLAEQGMGSSGLWLRLAKKGTPTRSIDYAQALEGALCHGWIDSQKRALDEQFWLQRFTPRGAKSIWSKINREKAEALIKEGRMTPAGLSEVERARSDGRWQAAYDSQKNAVVPPDLLAALAQNAAAKAFFATLDSGNRYAILFRLHGAKKAETREKRLRKFIAMLEAKEKIHG